MMVNCDCCEQWFHTLCSQYSSSKKEEKFYCPLCICEEELQKTKEAIATIVQKYVNPEIEPIFKVIVPEKKKDSLPSYNSMDHKRDWETASDDYYYSQGEEYPSRLRNEIPTKRRKSERLSEKPRLLVPLEERVITFEDKKKKEEIVPDINDTCYGSCISYRSQWLMKNSSVFCASLISLDSDVLYDHSCSQYACLSMCHDDAGTTTIFSIISFFI